MPPLTSEIPEAREVSVGERSLVQWLLDHAARDASSYFSQVDLIRVHSRCGCGCASLNFAIGDRGWPEKGAMKIISDHDWDGPGGSQCGIFLFDHFGTLAGIDVYSADGRIVPNRLPAIGELERTIELREAAARAAGLSDEERDSLPLTAEQEQELDRRLDAVEREGSVGMSSDELLEQVRRRLP